TEGLKLIAADVDEDRGLRGVNFAVPVAERLGLNPDIEFVGMNVLYLDS
ncbi:unnamed protein product, partial [marine sediment metagenome]